MKVTYIDNFKPSEKQQASIEQLFKVAGPAIISAEVHHTFEAGSSDMPTGISMVMNAEKPVDVTLIGMDAFSYMAAARVKSDNVKKSTFLQRPLESFQPPAEKLSLEHTFNSVGREVEIWDPEHRNGFVKACALRNLDKKDYFLVVKSSVPEQVIHDLRDYAEGKTWGELVRSGKLEQVSRLSKRNVERLLKEAADHYGVRVNMEKDAQSAHLEHLNNAVPYRVIPEYAHHTSCIRRADNYYNALVTCEATPVQDIRKPFLAVDHQNADQLHLLPLTKLQDMPQVRTISSKHKDGRHTGWDKKKHKHTMLEIKRK